MAIKKTLKEEGEFSIIELWSNGITNYLVQETKYGEEWDSDDFTNLEDAEKDFFFKTSEAEKAKAEDIDATETERGE